MLKKPKEVETSVKTPKITKLKKIYGRLKQWKWKKYFTASIRIIGTMGTVGTMGTMENRKKMKMGSRNQKEVNKLGYLMSL